MSLRDGEMPMDGERVDLVAEVAALWREIVVLRAEVVALRDQAFPVFDEMVPLEDRVAADLRHAVPEIIRQSVAASRAAQGKGL